MVMMVIAEIDWATMVPATITAIAVPWVGYLTLRMHSQVKEVKGEVAEMAPKVTAIDHAVNGQPPETPPLVAKVGAIIHEQNRVADELASKNATGGDGVQ